MSHPLQTSDREWVFRSRVTLPDSSIADGSVQDTVDPTEPSSKVIITSDGHNVMVGGVVSTGE